VKFYESPPNLDFLQDNFSLDFNVPTFPLSPLDSTSSSNSIFDLSSSTVSSPIINFFQDSFDDTTDISPSLVLSLESIPAKAACSACHRSKKICDRNRPCQRCVSRRQPHLCSDRPTRTKKRRKETPSPPQRSTPSPPQHSTITAFVETTYETSLVPYEKKREISTYTNNYFTKTSLTPMNNIKLETSASEPVGELGWRDMWMRYLRAHIDQLSQSPTWEMKKIICVSVCADKGYCPSSVSMFELYESIEKKNRSSILPMKQIPPLPVRYGMMKDEKIGGCQPALVFECSIIHNQEDYVLFEFGVNIEAERLFGYGREELYSFYRTRRKECLSRLIEPAQWDKVICREVKTIAYGETGFRLFITCINKWQCPIKVLLDVRMEVFAKTPTCNRHRISFFFIPLPQQIELI